MRFVETYYQLTCDANNTKAKPDVAAASPDDDDDDEPFNMEDIFAGKLFEFKFEFEFRKVK